MKNTKLVCIGANEIGYGEGIRQEEDWGILEEDFGFIRMSGFGEG